MLVQEKCIVSFDVLDPADREKVKKLIEEKEQPTTSSVLTPDKIELLKYLMTTSTGLNFWVPLVRLHQPPLTRQEIAAQLNTTESAVFAYIRGLGNYARHHGILRDFLFKSEGDPKRYSVPQETATLLGL